MAATKKTAAKQQTALKIVVDDGSVRVPIENTRGEEIGFFTFRPTDTGIVQRYKEVQDRIADVVEPLERAQINADGTADESVEGSAEALTEAQERLYDVCDHIFGGNMSEAFFGKMAPFSPIGGRFYFEIALENLWAFIEAQFKVETEAVSTRVEKYTRDYAKRGGQA